MNTNGTVFIVDDEPVGRKTLKALLFTEGYDLAFAANGPEALALAAELNPDVILLDVMMPGMDGFEVCRRLRAMPDQAEVPIIMVTALDDRAARLEAIEAGADDFITKPFDRVELRARVQAVIRLNRYRKLLQERTRRREAEEEARRQENELLLLQEVKRLQDEFISNASHELRTPLATITLISGNLDALYDKLDDDRRHKMIQDIRKQARALNQLIDGVLDISRLDQGRISGERHSLDLAGLVLEEIERQRPLAEEKSHRFMVAVNGPLPVWGDAGQLRQIVRNLLNNAIKYTPAEGRISCQSRIFADNLAADPTWPGSDQLPEGSWVGLRVVDNGVGIAPEQLTRLFERFYRVQPQSVIPGTGLGLAIAKELTELHRGRIAVVSQPGSGTTFAIYLPVADA